MEVKSFYKELIYAQDKPVITVILETTTSKELRIALGKDVLMKEHKAPYPIIIQVLEGAIDFGVDIEKSALYKGDIIGLEASIPHSLLARENSVVRLTLQKADKVERVKSVVE